MAKHSKAIQHEQMLRRSALCGSSQIGTVQRAGHPLESQQTVERDLLPPTEIQGNADDPTP
jgi:hypothetical protein